VIVVVGLLAGMLPAAGQEAQPHPRLQHQSELFFEQNDRDRDGKLTRDEFPDRAKQLFDRIDANKDGAVTPEEEIAFRAARAARQRPAPPAPEVADVQYGPDDANTFDLWLAESDRPTPLVIFYHGGAFRGGDKRGISADLLKQLLAAGVSVAAANYRLSGTAPFPAQMHDSARALQFIRHHAAEYNIDPRRIGATGGSAGAGISLWLAFHDDLADASSADPVARQSTRLTAVAVQAAQSSYDPRFIFKLFDTTRTDEALVAFFGMKSWEDLDDPAFRPLFEEASPITHATSDDAPVMLFYPQANEPLPPNSSGNQHIHHPKFGFALKEKLDTLGLECELLLREQHPDGVPVGEFVKFFLDKFGAG
jgi:acetyl esterase/lipase